jgi:hypothetical protein
VKFLSGETRHAITYLAFGIYVSSHGRPFIRSARSVVTRSPQTPTLAAGDSRSPDGAVIRTGAPRPTKWEFQGRQLAGYTTYESGVRRIIVVFDESFRTCTFDVTYAKEAGVPGIIAHTLNTQLAIRGDVKVTPQSCTVIDGNTFGGGDNR